MQINDTMTPGNYAINASVNRTYLCSFDSDKEHIYMGMVEVIQSDNPLNVSVNSVATLKCKVVDNVTHSDLIYNVNFYNSTHRLTETSMPMDSGWATLDFMGGM
jgi:anionic cell wall polymer biosynthesis LytR-Cps2A-Psr (LCP) family protein